MAVNHLWNPRPGYVNQSDGSVGILGKAFGSLGLDADGARGATGWEDAWRNSVDADTSGRQASMLPITSDGGYGVPTMLSAPLEGFNSMWERGDEANVLNPESLRQSSEESFDAAGLAATGGLAAGALGAVPEGAIAANGGGWGSRLQSFRERLPAANEANDFSVEGLFPYVGLDKLPAGTAQFMDGALPRGQETVNLSDLISHQREVFGPNVEGIAKSGADGWTHDGRPLNAPTVYKLPTGELLLQDGNHRLSAAALNGDSTALVDMFYANSPTSAAAPLAVNALERGDGASFLRFVRDAQAPPQNKVYGEGQYQLMLDREMSGMSQFDILRGGEPIGSVSVTRHPDEGIGHIDTIDVDDGSNGLGLRGLRDLREAFRQYDPSIKTFEGDRDYSQKTGSAASGSKSSGRPDTKTQSVVLPANHPFSSAAPLAFTDNEDNSRNALMPPRHHSFSQNRSASGQFSK